MLYSMEGDNISYVYDMKGNTLSSVYDMEGNDIAFQPYSIAFSEMSLTDEDGIASVSSEHLRNAKSGYKIYSSVDSTEQTIKFDCDVKTNGQRIGFWIWMDRRTLGVYGGNDYDSYYATMSIKVNNTIKTYRHDGSGGNCLKSGFNYYWFSYDEVGDNITSVQITWQGQIGATMYLDSLEVGYKMTDKAIIMFNLDCSANNFYNSAGYELFKSYGFPCTYQYTLNTTTLGDTAPAFDIELHKKLITEGFDYATYSGWITAEGEIKPSYDNEADYDVWKNHADLMWQLNNSVGVYAPSIVHSTGFKSGETYQKAMVDAGFPMIRTDNPNGKASCFAYFDPVDYREIKPYFFYNIFSAEGDIINSVKASILYAINNNLCLQIGTHIVKPEDYEPSEGVDMNCGVLAMEEILKYVKKYVDSGKCEVLTSNGFLEKCAPDLYKTWYEKRKQSVVY